MSEIAKEIGGYFTIAIITGAFFGTMIWAIRNIVPHRSVSDNVGAPEGNDHNFRLRSIDDDKYWDDV